MPEPVKRMPAADIAKLLRVDAAYRSGQMQQAVAESEGYSSRESLFGWLERRGFKLELSRTHGPRVVATLDGTSLQEWLDSGYLAPQEEETANAAH